MPSSRHHQHQHQHHQLQQQQRLLTTQIPEPRKSILPSFDDDTDSPSDLPSAYTLDFDFSEFDTQLFPTPQFETFLTGSYLGHGDDDDRDGDNDNDDNDDDDDEEKKRKKLAKHRLDADPETPFPFSVPVPVPVPVPDVKLSSFAELEEDCSALQLDSEVIVLTRPRTPFTQSQSQSQSHSHFQTLAVPSTSRAPSPVGQVVAPRTQSGIVRKESKYQRNAPPHLHLKSSNYDHHHRRLSYSRRQSSRRDTRSSLGLANDISLSSPAPTNHPIDSNPNTPRSPPFRAFRVSYASSKSSKRGSRIHFSTKELHRRRILKLQRTFGERVPLELVAVSPARRRRRRSSRPFSVVSYRGPYALANTLGADGQQINPSVGDWTLDRIAPPPPPSAKPRSSCGIFRTSVGDSSSRNRRPKNTLRKSRMAGPRRAVDEESFEVIEHEGPLEVGEGEEGQGEGEGEEGEEGHLDRGDNSIWLDEDPPLARRNQAWRTSRLVPAHEHEALAVIRAMGVYLDDAPANVVADPVTAAAAPSRPISDLSVMDRYTSMAPSRSSSSPSMPAFCHGSDSDHLHLQHQYQHLQNQHLQNQQQQLHPLPALPKTPAVSPATPGMISPALFWPRMPFTAPIIEQVVSSPMSGSSPLPPAFSPHPPLHPSSPFPLEPYDLSLFEDTPEVVLSTRRSERRQGWSGEWNQPSIRDVIKKLRYI